MCALAGIPLIVNTSSGIMNTDSGHREHSPERSDGEEAMQVLEAIRQVRRESIRQRIRKLLQANDLSNMWRDWDRLYKRRSGLFHGRSEAGSEHRGSHLEESTLSERGQEAIKLSARIVLSMAKREGLAVPGRAKVHFGVD